MNYKNRSVEVSLEVGSTRRRFIAGTAAASFLLPMASPAVVRAQEKVLVVPNGGGALEEAYKAAYFEPFARKTGTRIVSAPSMTAARLKAMVENNSVDVDVLITSTETALISGKAGLAMPIDYGVIDKSALEHWAPKEFYLGIDVAAYVIAWSTKAFTDSTRPRTWADVFNPSKVPGQRGFWKQPVQTLDAAALAAGQPRDKLYPIDLEPAFKAIDRVKPSTTWWTSGAQSAQLISSGEIELGGLWNGRLFAAQQQGAKVSYSFDECIYTCDAFMVPKGSKNPKLAMEFAAFILQPQNQAAFAKIIPYGPANPKSFSLLSKEVLDRLPNSPANAKTGVYPDNNYWAENGQKLFAMFNERVSR